MSESGTAGLTRTRKTLHKLPLVRGRLVYYRHQDDTPVDTTISIRRSDYDDMGRPDTITVTIEPGDHLNDDV